MEEVTQTEREEFWRRNFFRTGNVYGWRPEVFKQRLDGESLPDRVEWTNGQISHLKNVMRIAEEQERARDEAEMEYQRQIGREDTQMNRLKNKERIILLG